MVNNTKIEPPRKIYELPQIKSKYSSRLISKVVSITFGIILLLCLVALFVAIFVRVNVTIDATGQLEPSTLITLHSPVSGEIANVFVKGSQLIKKNQLLLQFDSVKIKDQLNKILSDLEIKKINYEIRKKTIPIEMEQNELQIKKAEAQLLKARAGLREKMGNYFPGVNIDSFTVAYKKGSHIAIDYAVAEIISAESELQSLRSKMDVQQINTMQLKTMSLEIEQLQTNVYRQIEYLSKSKIYAPFDGIVLTEDMGRLKGTIQNEGASIFEISSNNDWKAILTISEKDAYELVVGDSVRIEIKAMKLADDFLLIPGKVVSIAAEPIKNSNNQISSGNFKVEVALNVESGRKYLSRIRRGFSIDAKILKDNDRIINVLRKNIRKIL
jgi:multidrug efflux pump subunit AcrA (membrane-fusion protein)